MALRVVSYESRWEKAAQAFNERLRRSGNLPFPLAEKAPEPLTEAAVAAGINYLHFLVVDEADEVRGGYFIRTQRFLVRGQVQTVGHFSAPLSEGIIEKRYASAGLMMVNHALKQQPLLFAMGMGSLSQPLPRMLKAMKWPVFETPFYFLVLNGTKFLRNAGPLRRSKEMRLVSNILSVTGLGGLVVRGAQWIRRRSSFDKRYSKLEIQNFSGWPDEVWRQCNSQYAMSAVRDAAYLQFIYPQTGKSFYGVQLTESGTPAGWVEMLDCSVSNRAYFGDLKVAALLDGVGPLKALPSLIEAGVEMAAGHQADIVICNQMHQEWGAALTRAGFWSGPSNYLLALSPQLSKLLDPLENSRPLIHFNRGDGDGWVNLVSS